MRTVIRDQSVLAALSPVDVIGYLRASGWVRETEIGERASLWVRGDNADADITVPHVRGAVDFPIRIGEVIRTLEMIEKRSQEEILADLLTASSDLIRIRSLAPEAGDGTVQLDAGVRLVEHSRDLIMAAACATVTTKAYWARRKPAQAVDFIEGVRMGQTERGSYVLTIHCPVPPELKTLFPTVSPFERRVTSTLTSALTSVRDAARQAVETGEIKPFFAAVQSGVSANLCDALVGLGRISPDHGIEISVSWARNRPAEQAHSSVSVSSDLLPVIDEAARVFKGTAPQEDVEIIGFVEKLDRPVGSEIGRVSILAPIEKERRRVLVELGDPEYLEAVRAHGNNLPITSSGDLVKEGGFLVLRHVQSFLVLEPES